MMGRSWGSSTRLVTIRTPLSAPCKGEPGDLRVPWGRSSSSTGQAQQKERWRLPVPARQHPGRTSCGRSSSSSCRRAARRRLMGTPVPAGLSRRGTLKLAAAVAGGLAVGAPLSGQQTIAQEEKLTASGGGVNLKLMPDVEGVPTVPLRESFMFDAHYAQCIIEDNPEPFSMETYSVGKVIIDAHSFFMGMYANEVSLVSIRDAGNGTRVAKLTGALGCATEAGTATGRVGSREAQEPAFFEIEATDGGHGGGAARDTFVFTVFFDPKPAFTGEMISGEITIAAPAVLPLISGTPTP